MKTDRGGPEHIVGDASNTKKHATNRRLRALAIHLGVYFLTMTVLVGVNFITSPGNMWSVLPMIGWGPVLALHTAYAMGLFGELFQAQSGKPD